MVKLQSSKLSLWVRIPLPLFVTPFMWRFIINIFFFLKNVFLQNRRLFMLLSLLLDWLIATFKVDILDAEGSDDEFLRTESSRYILFKGLYWSLIDFFFLYITSKNFSLYVRNNTTLYTTKKADQLSNNNFLRFNNSTTVKNNKQLFLYGLQSLWCHMRMWLLPISIIVLFVYYSFFIKSLPFSKVFFSYLLLGNMFYLLISGFVFFIKKYQYRLYTSSIQRFWRRSLIIFWAIEASLFSVFIYLIFNASQEPVHVYDNIQIYKTHFYSWRYFFAKIMLSTLLIVLTYMLLLSLKWNTFTKSNNIVFFITIILLYISWLEFYQLFHLMNCYGTSNWVYDFTEHLWNLELEFKRTRIVNHYVTIGLIAKFWHVVFAVVFWIFFILRCLESSRYRYPLLVANLQNFVIIYIMSWLYMYPWFKYTARKALDVPYFWFFVNNRRFGFYLFFNDIKLYSWALFDFFSQTFSYKGFTSKPFYYWHNSSIFLDNTQFRKHNIRDLFIRDLS